MKEFRDSLLTSFLVKSLLLRNHFSFFLGEIAPVLNSALTIMLPLLGVLTKNLDLRLSQLLLHLCLAAVG